MSRSASQIGISIATVTLSFDQHEFLQRLVPQLVVADGRDDEAGDAGRDVLLAVHDDARDVGECGPRLRRATALTPRGRGRAGR